MPCIKEYQAKLAVLEEKKTEIGLRLAEIVSSVEKEHGKVWETIDTLSLRCIDSLRSLGVEDGIIYSLFDRNMDDASYLKERQLLYL